MPGSHAAWSRTPLVDGVDRRDAGARRDDFWPLLQAIGVMGWREEAHGVALHRQMVPFVQDGLRYGMKARLPLVGCKAQQIRQGLCQRGATRRQGERLPGPLGPDPLANHLVKWPVRDLEAGCHGSMRALAKAGVCGAQVTGMADGTAVETTAPDTGRGQVPRPVRSAETRGRMHEREVTGYGGNVFLLIEAATQMPWAVNVGPMHAHEARWTRALVTQARRHRPGDARRHQVVVDQGCVDGTTRWWLDQPELTCVVPADARAQAAADDGLPVGRRVHTVRHGQGHTARPARLETAVGGMTGLTTEDPSGTPAHGRQPHRRDCQPHPINAVVVRKWRGKDDGPGGTTVFLTNGSVAKPRQPCDDARRLSEHCGLTDAKPPWDLGHPPPTTDRAVRVHGLGTRLMGALATASRLACAREARGEEPVGWQRWRRQRVEQTRDQVMVCAPGYDGLFPLAEYSRRLGVRRNDVPPEVGSRQQVLAKYRLPARDYPFP